MAKTYIQPGHCLTIPAPTGGVTNGTPFLLGTIVLIPTATAAQTVSVACCVSGVQSVPKADSQAWTVGAAVYWDDTAKNFTTTSSGNTAAGFAVEAVGSGSGLTAGKVMLNGLPGCCCG